MSRTWPWKSSEDASLSLAANWLKSVIGTSSNHAQCVLLSHPFCRVILMASQWATVLTSLANCGALFKDKVALLREQGLLISN